MRIAGASGLWKQEDSTSSRDEKAKLESILLGKMMDGTAAGMRMDGSGPGGASGGGAGTTSLNHFTNRFLGGKWPRTNTPAVILANRPLPPNYVCTNCKKPGHHKQLCPEPVIFFFFRGGFSYSLGIEKKIKIEKGFRGAE